MSIRPIRVYQVICDGCGAPGPIRPSKIVAWDEARQVGWERCDGQQLCPLCAPEITVELIPPPTAIINPSAN